MRWFCFAALWLLPLNLPTLGGEHSPLLPHPQEVRYGAGQLGIRDLAITFGSPAAPEDRLAAEQLSSALSERTGTLIPVTVGPRAAHVIQLYRTASAADLPQPGEQRGPDSPESYSIRTAISRPAAVLRRGRAPRLSCPWWKSETGHLSPTAAPWWI